jgi:hypothetical protein
MRTGTNPASRPDVGVKDDIVRWTVALAVVVVVAGCAQAQSRSGFAAPVDAGEGDGGDQVSGPNCPGLCITSGLAELDLSCAASDLTSVVVTGPCAEGDANPDNYLDRYNERYLFLGSATPGVCHVELIFATGFTYSTDVTFESVAQPGLPGCPGCAPYVGPTQTTFVVDNPSSTCGDGGSDAGAG